MPCFGCGNEVIFEVYTDHKTGNRAMKGTCFECPEAIKVSHGSVRHNPMLLILTNSEDNHQEGQICNTDTCHICWPVE